jgi:Fe-S-cluster containining protein
MVDPADGLVRARVEITLSGVEFKTEVPIPRGPARSRDLFPVVRAFTGAIAEASEGMARAQGRSISCRAGCGACCRQLVPLATSEVHHLRALVDNLPEPRRSEVRGRFAAAVARLRDAGMLEALGNPGSHDEATMERITDDYFRLGIACPFLERESCSIHAERPIICREYLVISPAQHCAETDQKRTERLPLAGRPSIALMRLDDAGESAQPQWIPLTLALEATATPPEAEPVPGPELFGRFLERLRETSAYPESASG